MRYVILGGGIAGTTAAEELRKRDAAAEITIFDQEEHPCYSRVLLPHYVKGQIPREKVFLRREEWYRDNRIEHLHGTRITAVDTKNKFVRTLEFREFPYDKLLVATGGEVKLADEDPRGTSYLRTLDDADHLRALLVDVLTLPEAERRGVVVGGGFIALEYINIFAHFKIATTVVMRGSGFWSRNLSSHAQELMALHAKAHGVELITGQTSSLMGDTVLTGVQIASGRVLPTTIVGIGIGQHTDTSLLEDANIPFHDGVLANTYLETAIADVYTAGDVAEAMHPVIGRQLLLGNWTNAQMQGRAVAKTMTGERTEYGLLTSYATQLLGMHLAFIGDTSREHADEVRAHKVTNSAAVDLYVRNRQIVGAVLVGDVSERAAITKAIQEKRENL